MTRNAKISLTAIGLVAAVVVTLALLTRPATPDSPAQAVQPDSSPVAPTSLLIRPDSHRLSTAADGKVTVVEFLDLECEACGAAFPGVEKLRAEFQGRVTFVIRYFPVPSHHNAELAARSVEAAGRQGKLEAMYRTMYENQPKWGDQNVSHRETFFGFARQLGLDLPTFEKDLDAPATAARVARDRADGTALGVRGTPTFFINGRRFDSPPTYEALEAALDAEFAR
ncbi:DsbA family protein [Amycolatopsis sp. NPDC003861]